MGSPIKRKFNQYQDKLFHEDDLLINDDAGFDDDNDSSDEEIEDDFSKINIDGESEDEDNDEINEKYLSDSDSGNHEESESDEWEDIEEDESEVEEEEETSDEKEDDDDKVIKDENNVEKNLTKYKSNMKYTSKKLSTTENVEAKSKTNHSSSLAKKDSAKKSNLPKSSSSSKMSVQADTSLKAEDKKDIDETPSSSIKTDEYAQDSSDEEDLRNTIGNIPINWYDEYDHLGYGLDSLPIMKPSKRDALDSFLEKLENPDYFRTVFDKQTGQNVKLTDEHLDLVMRIMNHKVPNPAHDMYAPFPDLYSHEVMEMPLSGRPEHKRSFLPSKYERQKVARIARVIRREILMRKKKEKKSKKEESSKFYDIWKPRSEEDGRLGRITDPIPAPKLPLPGHISSYNPPPEYLMTDKDVQRLEQGQSANSSNIIGSQSRKIKSVRAIPRYENTVKERFSRLMDLYLAPRMKYKKVVAKAKEFLPELPDKKDLRPYPTLEGIKYLGHMSIIRTISVHPGGKYLASGSDDNSVKIWEINTGRCLRTFQVGHVVRSITWNPNPKLFLIGMALSTSVVCLNPESYLVDKIVVQQTNSIFQEEVEQGDYITPTRVEDAVKWRKPTNEEWTNGYRVVLDHFKEVKEVVWHKQGDYFASVIPDGDHRSVLVHQLSRWRSQLPFKKSKGRVQTVKFHPKLPQLFVCTQSHVRLYDLKRQTILKKIYAKTRWISTMSVHPGGEHFIVGGYDRRVNWFEMECTRRPHLMRYHNLGVRSVKFHRKYPLYASASDDKLVVTHATVYDDWLRDPLLVPLKNLKGHRKFDDLYVLDVAWHPHEPFLFTAGADATIRLWH